MANKKITVLNLNTLKKGTEELSSKLLEDKSGEGCVARVVNWQLANKRTGSASTKLMSEISGSTRKIRAQKGTGGARHGSIRAVQFRGGRTCFGPLPRDFGYKLPKKIVQKALKFVLREKIRKDKVIIIEGLDKLKISTKDLSKKLKDNKIGEALVVYTEAVDNFLKSLRNIPKFKALVSKALNVYDMLKYELILLDKEAFEKIKEVLK